MEKQGKAKSGLGIKFRMLIFILPPVLIAFVVMSLITSRLAKSEFSDLTTKYVESETKAQINDIDGQLETIRVTAENLSNLVSATYITTTMHQYRVIFSDIIMRTPLQTP